MQPVVTTSVTGSRYPFSTVWLVIWAFSISLGWLLTNHSIPWTAFHFDAWIATGLLLAAMTVLSRSAEAATVYPLVALCACILSIPFIQYGLGILPFVGQAWIGSIFLLGFLLAMLTGAKWESCANSQPIDGLFLAIGTASIFSVGMQFYQWFDLSFGSLDWWIASGAKGRPFANFNQPNQLATFLLWGILATAWGMLRQQIFGKVAILLTLYLLIGVALTGSRTAFVAIFGLFVTTYACRKQWPHPAFGWHVTMLAVFYGICFFALPQISSYLMLETTQGVFSGESSASRINAYQLFVTAALNQPLVGYGWGQTSTAQLSVAETQQVLGGIFSHAHNLFLDIVLWCGIPMGLAVSFGLCGWFLSKYKKISNPENAILLAFVGVVAWHSMVELPLHYAYMLLPTGLVIGVLDARLCTKPLLKLPRTVFAGVVFVSATLLGLIVCDYLKVEENFQLLRFERARIGKKPETTPAPTILLNHMDAFVDIARFVPVAGVSQEYLRLMRDVTYAYPSYLNLYNFSLTLGLNHQKNAAQTMISKLSCISTSKEFELAQKLWKTQAKSNPALDSMNWTTCANGGLQSVQP